MAKRRKKKKDTISTGEIRKRIVRGADIARNKFRQMTSREFTLDESSEGFVQAIVCLEIAGKRRAPWLTLETSVKDIIAESNADPRGPHSRKSKKGRIDAVVWWKNSTPRAAIEFKNGFVTRELEADATRLDQVLRRVGNLSVVFLVVTISAAARETLESKRRQLPEIAGSGWRLSGMTAIRPTRGYEPPWFDATFVLEKKRAHAAA
jgi:hypothetical protein